MIVGRILQVSLIVVVIPVYVWTLTSLSVMNKQFPRRVGVSTVLPSAILKVTSLDFDGLTADFIYLKALVFYGGTYTKGKQRKVEEWEYAWLFNMLDVSTDLDPYFLDPYFFANGALGWDTKRLTKVNLLLEKGSRYREWDFWLPYFLGFNYYFFLNDNIKAAEYLMMASKKPDADPFFGYFAARLAYKGNRTENAIMFLTSMLKTTKDESLRHDYEIRLQALQAILELEKAVAVYKDKTGTYPADLNALVEQKIIAGLPKDPYGGKFYVNKDGMVKTTSDLRQMN